MKFPIRPDEGRPIPGSRLVRAYCAHCGEPMRVIRWTGFHICLDCGDYRPVPDHVRASRDGDDSSAEL